MAKKQKAAGKAVKKLGGKLKKGGSAVSRGGSGKAAKAGKSPAKSLKSAKSVKKVAKKVIRAVVKTAVKKIKSKIAGKNDTKKNAAKKAVNTKQPVSKKKNGKPALKAATSSAKTTVKPIAKQTKHPVAAKPANNKGPQKATPVKPVPAFSKDGISRNGSDKKKPEPAVEKTSNQQDKGRKLADLFVKKPIERKPDDVLAITNTIPVKSKNEISPSKIASISYSITNPVKKTDSYAVKAEKEPQGKFEMEFVVHASAEMLYEFLSTPSGLSEWFCDDLNIRNGIYTFIWDDQLQQARLLKTVDQQLVRFQWVDKTDGSYFEFRIQRDDLTNDISLIITDFADTASERESSKLLWNSQVEKLMHVIGSIF